MKKLLKIFSVWNPLSVWLFLRAKGEKVGEDQFGNSYFRSPAKAGYNHERRWVSYNGTVEASKIPPEWHGWMHHQTDVLPTEDDQYRKSWQKPHEPNKTGTAHAYHPPGHMLSGSHTPKKDYEAWTPSKAQSK